MEFGMIGVIAFWLAVLGWMQLRERKVDREARNIHITMPKKPGEVGWIATDSTTNRSVFGIKPTYGITPNDAINYRWYTHMDLDHADRIRGFHERVLNRALDLHRSNG